MISTARLAEAFVEIADTLVDDYDIVEFLGSLTIHAAEISGAEAVGLLLVDHHDQLRFMASSNESGTFLELLQLQNGEGPCWDCVHSGTPVINADLASAADQWPAFVAPALALGFQSVHAVPMRLRSSTVGALGLFGTADVKFDDDEVKIVQALADAATIAILQERSLSRAEALTEQLQGALNSRVVVEQAKGALAQLNGVHPDEAFEDLRRRARSSRRRLVDVARRVLDEIERSGGSRNAR